ncbi:cyclin domain containing [Cystoisospora suis]|uniref:Cyclin domain containing n=1 Tax=Cystoisospora suis TaxID=483139 RepID=A0A2C6LCV5_9APIC|nr:cyclin domain containing [Cystoisospora suis]
MRKAPHYQLRSDDTRWKIRPARRPAFSMLLPECEASREGEGETSSGSSTSRPGESAFTSVAGALGADDDFEETTTENVTTSETDLTIVRRSIGSTKKNKNAAGGAGNKHHRGEGSESLRACVPVSGQNKYGTGMSSKTHQTRGTIGRASGGRRTHSASGHDDCFDFSWASKDFVTCEQIVSLLESSSMISVYGSDVEKNDPSSSPFHSSHPPTISLRDYFLGRIVKYTQMRSTDFVLAVIFIGKLLAVRQPVERCEMGDRQSRPSCYSPVHIARKGTLDPAGRRGFGTVEEERRGPVFRKVPQEEGVEFNILTAHRLLLTACLIANKVHYDRHIVLRHWAKVK